MPDITITSKYTLAKAAYIIKEDQTYTEKDKIIFIRELRNYNINLFLSDIPYDLNKFDSFIYFMTFNPHQTPQKCGIYITKIMRYDDSPENTGYTLPQITHNLKLGDCDDGAIICHYVLVRAGYTKTIKDSQISVPAKLSNKTEIKTFANSIFKYPLIVGLSTDPLSKPIDMCNFHGVCVYSELNSDLLNVLEVGDGLTYTKSKDLIELADKFVPRWQRIVIKHAKDGKIDNAIPYILIERTDVKPAK